MRRIASVDCYGNIQVNGTGIYTRITEWTASTDGLRRMCTVKVWWQDGLGTQHWVYASRQQDLK